MRLDFPEKTPIGLTTSAGAQVRKERPSGFAIYPEFLTTSEHRVFTPGDSDQHVWVEAFRLGARAKYVDVEAAEDTIRVLQLPDSARYFYALARRPVVVGDTGSVDIYASVYLKEDAPLQITIFRYRFLWVRGEGWKYQGRVLLYGA